MRPDEPKMFLDPEHEIDLGDERRLEYWSERLKATPEEISEAVEAVGTNKTAVAIYLGSADAL